MNANTGEILSKLEKNLEAIVKVYRHLLTVVRREKEILIAANLDDLNENNRAKEVSLLKARELEEQRLNLVRDLAKAEGLNPDNIRLLDFANHIGGEKGDKLRQFHSVLGLLLKRVRQHNEQNEVLVNAALNHITGGIQNVKETLGNKKNYKKGGKLQEAPAESGQLVSREA